MRQPSAKTARRRRPHRPARPEDSSAPVDEEKAEVDAHLDEGLEETFPASDPVSISPGAD